MDTKKDNSLKKKENTTKTANHSRHNKVFLLCISDHAIPNPIPKSNQYKFTNSTKIKSNILKELLTSNN